MPRYFYTAKSLKGNIKTESAEAPNKRELARILRKEGYILISAYSEEKKEKSKFNFSISFLGKVSLVDKLMFTRNLGIMIEAGVPLPRSLKVLAQQAKSKKFSKALLKIAEEIVKGKSFSECLKQYPHIFSDLFSSMIRVGEEAGTLEEVLKVLTHQLEREHELKNKIKGAMIYPAVIIIAMIMIGTIMLILVIPQLTKTFEELEIELPLTTRIVIKIGNSLAKFWYLIPIFVLGLIAGLRMLLKTKPGKIFFDKTILSTPVLNSIVKKINSAYTSRTLSSLISAGVPIIKSLEITANVLKNYYYQKAILETIKKVKKGEKLSSALSEYKDIYPALIIEMIAVGEETGETAEILKKLAIFFEEEISNITKNLSSIIEPGLMLLVGIIVGFFAISIIQPIYSMINKL